jgi:rsbT co-antagonist protein RsbR
MAADSTIARTLKNHRADILAGWRMNLQTEIAGARGRISSQDLGAQAEQFLDMLTDMASAGGVADRTSEGFRALQNFVDELSRARVQQGFSSAETATFVFSAKEPLFRALRSEVGKDADVLADAVWEATQLVDSLGLMTVSSYQRTREDIINRQQAEMLELSTPVVKLWDGILALPMIGTLDSSRTQIVMESLLQKIVETGSEIAIIDITGVPTVDTLVAQHLLKTITAIRLMGADCIISGVRPQIAQTIVHLGVDLQGVTTKANLADALGLALKRTGNAMSR